LAGLEFVFAVQLRQPKLKEFRVIESRVVPFEGLEHPLNVFV
jgi:hypothetical protein